MAEFHVVLEKQPEGGFTVQCVEIPGAISEGDNEEEALENIRDAIAGVLEVRRENALRQRTHGATLRTVDVEAES